MARCDVKGHWLECQGQKGGRRGETGTERVGWGPEAMFLSGPGHQRAIAGVREELGLRGSEPEVPRQQERV